MNEARNCGTCRDFQRPQGRAEQSCEQRGESAGNSPCPLYRPRIANVGALPEEQYRDVFHEVLAESFVLEQDARLAVDTIKAQLQAQGANISIDDNTTFDHSARRVIDLYVLYRMTMAVGLGRYADDIVRAEIARRFQ